MDKQSGQWAFLIQVYNENEANIIESLLDSEGIPVIRRYQEAGDYLKIYMGMTSFGVDIYVPEDRIEQAHILVDIKENKRIGIKRRQ